MPLKANSLIGFVRDERQALSYLGQTCVPADPSEKALRRQWLDAQSRLGQPLPNAGNPKIEPVPKDCEPYLNGLKARADFKDFFKGKTWSFCLVEIAPLLAFQFQVLDIKVKK